MGSAGSSTGCPGQQDSIGNMLPGGRLNDTEAPFVAKDGREQVVVLLRNSRRARAPTRESFCRRLVSWLLAAVVRPVSMGSRDDFCLQTYEIYSGKPSDISTYLANFAGKQRVMAISKHLGRIVVILLCIPEAGIPAYIGIQSFTRPARMAPSSIFPGMIRLMALTTVFRTASWI